MPKHRTWLARGSQRFNEVYRQFQRSLGQRCLSRRQPRLHFPSQPMNGFYRCPKSTFFISKNLISVMANAIPAPCILRVAAKLIKTKSAIRAEKNIDTDVFSAQIDGAHDLVFMGNSLARHCCQHRRSLGKAFFPCGQLGRNCPPFSVIMPKIEVAKRRPDSDAGHTHRR